MSPREGSANVMVFEMGMSIMNWLDTFSIMSHLVWVILLIDKVNFMALTLKIFLGENIGQGCLVNTKIHENEVELFRK